MTPTLRNELSIYERHANEWWDERSPRFRSLHRVNETRLELIEEWVGSEIEGRRLVDLGCGGGLLSEPLAARGADVCGIDLSPGSVAEARRHAGTGSNSPRYLCADARHVPLDTGSANGVLLADVLEHLEQPAEAMAEAARLLRLGGWLYVNTINRTLRARWLAVHLAEGVKLIPKGTHDPRLFIRPSELKRMARSEGLAFERIVGERPALIPTLRKGAIHLKRSHSTAVAYSALFRKVVP